MNNNMYQPSYYPQYPQYQMPSYQQAYQQPYVGVQNKLNGQMVDSIDAVKVKDVDMTGQPTFYPNINGTEIYKKQLQQDGTCSTVVYRMVNTTMNDADNKPVTMGDLRNVIEQLKQDLLQPKKRGASNESA